MNKIQSTPSQAAPFDQFVNLTFPAMPQAEHGIVVWVGITVLGTAAEQVKTTVKDNHGHTYFRVAWQWHPVGHVQAEIWYLPQIVRTGTSFVITVATNQTSAKPMAKAVELGPLGIRGLEVNLSAQDKGESNTPDTGMTQSSRKLESFAAAMTVSATSDPVQTFTIESVTPPWVKEFSSASFFYFPGEGDSRFVGPGPQHAKWTCTQSGKWSAVLALFSTKILPPVIRNLTGPVRQFGGTILCFIGPPHRTVEWRIVQGHGTLTPYTTFTDELGRCSCRFDSAGIVERVVIGAAYVP